MNPCHDWVEPLLRYADGELDEDRTKPLKTHLDECPACRRQLAALTRSLTLATEVWSHSATRRVDSAAEKERFASGWVAVSAAVVAILALAFWVSGVSIYSDQETADSDEVAPNANPSQPDSKSPVIAQQPVAAAGNGAAASIGDNEPSVARTEDITDISLVLANEARAARLAASAKQLADHPSLADYSRRADEYLISHYGDSNSARSAEIRNQK